MKVGLSEKRSTTPIKAIENLRNNGYQINKNKAQAEDAVTSYDERQPQSREGITVEQAIVMLQKKGLSVTPEQATEILELLRTLAKIEIDNYLKNENS